MIKNRFKNIPMDEWWDRCNDDISRVDNELYNSEIRDEFTDQEVEDLTNLSLYLNKIREITERYEGD